MNYEAFLDNKINSGCNSGIDVIDMPNELFDFQKSLVEWSLKKGRAAIFADCGLGKTPIQLAWADNISKHCDRPVLILAPLAVSAQTVREGEKFGIEVMRSKDGQPLGRVTITNYERLDRFSPADFCGVVCDESSILKSFDGSTRNAITQFMRKVPYRLLATATAAPNDYVELGTSSEALGYMGHMDMLAKFFKNDQNNCATRRMYGEATKWRFKGHGETPFWRWVCSWARACRKPSDLGFDDGRFVLQPMIEHCHMCHDVSVPDGYLFHVPATTLATQRDEKKRTVQERCGMVASMVNATSEPAVCWVQLNDEGSALRSMIPDAIEVSGNDSDDSKEDKFLDFAEGRARVLVTKAKIGALGLNWQHCSEVHYFPSHSFEQYYQAVRRCWRFGQKRQVNVHLTMTEGESRIMANLARKAEAASTMFDNLVREMNRGEHLNNRTEYGKKAQVPSWL